MKRETRKYCVECKEDTFRDKDDTAFICTGCGDRTPRTRIDKKFVNIDEVPEELLVERVNELPDALQDQYDAVMGRMHKLSANEKRVIELLHEGKTQNEAAEIMAITQREVSTYLKRARIKLQ